MSYTTGIYRRFKERFAVLENVVSLGEGLTPLVFSKDLSKETGCEVFLKFEGSNPTGSFKDRGMCMAVSNAVDKGQKVVLCASTGNTAASAAAYAASAGLSCFILVPKGAVSPSKISQALMYGGVVLEIEGTFDECLELVRHFGNSSRVAVVNSTNPYRISGQRSAAWEIVEMLGRTPDVHALPVGNAGNISAYWAGYGFYKNQKLPKMWGFQAQGSAPFILGKPVKNPSTVASAIRIGSPASWDLATAAVADSGGMFGAVSDDDILTTQKRLACLSGVFCEPASATGVAGVLAYKHLLAPGSLVVCTLTGSGLKDPVTIAPFLPEPTTVPSSVEFLEELFSKSSM